MGACATKPKVLKDGDEKPISQPDPPPQKEVPVVEVVPKETAAAVVNDSTVESADLPKNPSLGNLFNKESEAAKVSLGIESEKGKAVNSSQESDAVKAPEVVASVSKEALEVLPVPSATVVPDAPVEKDEIKVPEVIANENAEALPVAPTAISADVPIETEAIKAPEITEPSATSVDAPLAKENDGPVEKLDSKTSEIVPEDFTDALPATVVAAPAADVPVDDAATEIVSKENANASKNAPVDDAATETVSKENANASKNAPIHAAATEIVSKENANASENVGEKSIAGTEEYTDAFPQSVAPTLNTINTNNPLQSIEQAGANPVEENAKQLNIEDKKMVEEGNAVEKQAESINPMQESDVKQVKQVEILPDK